MEYSPECKRTAPQFIWHLDGEEDDEPFISYIYSTGNRSRINYSIREDGDVQPKKAKNNTYMNPRQYATATIEPNSVY